MRFATWAVSGLLVLSLGQPVLAQQKKSLAELMPAKALVFAEIHQPGNLAAEIRGLFEKSVLGNVPASLSKLRSKYEKELGWRRLEELAAFGLMLSPEVAKELQRVEGAAAAFTGFGAKGDPEYLAVVLPGQSQAPSFMLRALLAMERTKVTETFEDVALHRGYHPTFGPATPPGAIAEVGPYFAIMDQALVIGSPVETVKDVILRVKGKKAGPSLADDANYQEMAKHRNDRPGLHVHVNPQAFDFANKKELRLGVQELTILGVLFNAYRSISGSVTLEQGELQFRRTDVFNPKAGIVVRDVLPTRPVDPSLLHYAPKDAVLAVALGNADGEKRWGKLLDIVDGLVPAGQGKPSDFITGLEKTLELSLGKDVLGQIQNIAFAMGDPLNAPVKKVVEKGPNSQIVRVGPEIPMVFLIQATDEKAAENLMKQLGKVLGQFGKPPKNLHYGRHGSVIVAGPYAAPVAEALKAGSQKQGLLSDAALASRLNKDKGAFILGMAKPTSLVLGGLMVSASISHSDSPAGQPADKKKAPQIDEGAQVGGPKVEVKETIEKDPDIELIKKELGKILSKQEWLVLAATLHEDRLEIAGKVDGLSNIVPAITDLIVEQIIKNYPRRDQPAIDHKKEKAKAPPPKETAGKLISTHKDQLTANDPLLPQRPGCRHKVYLVKMEKGQTYVIDLISPKEAFFDTYLILEDSSGKVLAEDDDGAGNLSSRLTFRCARTDVYRIIATSFGQGATGSYTMTIRE